MFYLSFQFSLLTLVVVSGALEDEDSDSNSLTTLESLIVTRTNGHGGPSNRSRTILELYQKVSDKENEDQEILLNLIEKSKDSKDKKADKNYVTKKPTIKKPIHQKRHKINKKDIVTEIQKKRRKRKKLIDKIKEQRRPSHMQLYWEKRLERAPKNVLDESLFRDEIKKTTPPPSRKGGSEMYKPTTTPASPTLHRHSQRHHRLHRPHHQHQHRQYKHKHKHRQAHGDTNDIDITATETKTDQSTKNMFHRQHSRISNTNIVLYKHSNTPDDYACKHWD